MESYWAVDHGVVSKKAGDSINPEHKQVQMTLPSGKTQLVDRGMKRTLKHMHKHGYQTCFSCQNSGKHPSTGSKNMGYVITAKDKRLHKLPQRYQVEDFDKNEFYPKGGTDLRFPAGNKATGIIHRAKLRHDITGVSKMVPKVTPALMREGYLPKRGKLVKLGAHAGAKWTHGLEQAAIRVETKKGKGKLVRMGTAGALRLIAKEPKHLTNIRHATRSGA